MAPTTSGYRASKNYSAFPVGRELVVKLQAKVRLEGVVAPVDFSAANFEVRLRLAPFPLVKPVVYDVNLPMTKDPGASSPGDTGKCSLTVIAPTVRERVHVEWVRIDTSISDGTTPSGKRERLLDLPWIARAFESPSP